MTSEEIKKALRRYFSDTRQWACFTEMKMGPSAYGSNSESRKDNDRAIDFFAMNMYASQNYRRVSCEIKISRADFLSEIKNPIKRRPAQLISNEFYFVVPEGLVDKKEVPIECGLMEIITRKNTTYSGDVLGEYLYPRIVLTAPWRDETYPSWAFMASLCRRIQKEEKGDDIYEN